jgi:hypothetical protein
LAVFGVQLRELLLQQGHKTLAGAGPQAQDTDHEKVNATLGSGPHHIFEAVRVVGQTGKDGRGQQAAPPLPALVPLMLILFFYCGSVTIILPSAFCGKSLRQSFLDVGPPIAL